MIPYRRNDWMILFNKRGVEIQECANLLNFPHSVIINCKITINYHALNYTWKADLSKCQLNKQEVIKTRLFHSRPQSLLSFWPAAGIESSGGNHFEITKEITEFCPSGFTAQSASMTHAWNGCSQSSRFLPQARRIVGSGDENEVVLNRRTSI